MDAQTSSQLLTSFVEGEKGAGQKVTDTVSGGSNDAQKQGGSMLDSASQMAGNAAKSVQDTLGMGGQSTFAHHSSANSGVPN